MHLKTAELILLEMTAGWGEGLRDEALNLEMN